MASFGSIGAVCPSSKFLARALIRSIDRRRGPHPLRILEIGPGTGVVSKRLLRRLGPGDRLDLVEINPRFAMWLRQWADTLPAGSASVRVHQGDILHFESEEPYDPVLSGLPFNSFPAEFVDQIFQRMMALSRPGATICFFQYLWLRDMRKLLKVGKSRCELDDIAQVIERWIGSHGVGDERVWMNLPPAGVHRLRAADHGLSTSVAGIKTAAA